MNRSIAEPHGRCYPSSFSPTSPLALVADRAAQVEEDHTYQARLAMELAEFHLSQAKRARETRARAEALIFGSGAA